MADDDIRAYCEKEMGLTPVKNAEAKEQQPADMDKDEEIRELRLALSAAQRALGGWQLCARQILNCILLTPSMNDYYSTLLKDLLGEVLLTVPQVNIPIV